MKIFLVFPGAIAILVGAVFILASAAPVIQRLLGIMILAVGVLVTYNAIFGDDEHNSND